MDKIALNRVTINFYGVSYTFILLLSTIH